MKDDNKKNNQNKSTGSVGKNENKRESGELGGQSESGQTDKNKTRRDSGESNSGTY